VTAPPDVYIVVIGILIILGLSTVSMFIRYQETSSAIEKATERFSDHFIYFPAFAQWFSSEGWQFSDLLWGYRTFTRIYELFGVEHDIQYAVLTQRGPSNIFTVLRGLIEDFSPIGALGWLFAFGILGGASYRRVLEGRKGYLPILTVIYAFTFTSMVFSLFTYTTPTLALILFWGYFVICSIGARDTISSQVELRFPASHHERMS